MVTWAQPSPVVSSTAAPRTRSRIDDGAVVTVMESTSLADERQRQDRTRLHRGVHLLAVLLGRRGVDDVHHRLSGVPAKARVQRASFVGWVVVVELEEL